MSEHNISKLDFKIIKILILEHNFNVCINMIMEDKWINYNKTRIRRSNNVTGIGKSYKN